MSAKVAFKAGELRRVSGSELDARMAGLEPTLAARASPFWSAIKERDEPGALALLQKDAGLARAALAVEPGEAGGWEAPAQGMDWLPAVNAAVQTDLFELAAALVERGAPLNIAEVWWEGAVADFKAGASYGRDLDGVSLQLLERLPLSYALRLSALSQAGSGSARAAAASELNGVDLWSGGESAARKVGASVLMFRDALARSGRELTVPSWVGSAVGRLAFSATRPLYAQADPLADKLNQAREELVEGVWRALVDAGQSPFRDLKEGELGVCCALRSAFNGARKDDAAFAMRCAAMLARCGALEAMECWLPHYQLKMRERLHNRGLGEWAEAIEAQRAKRALTLALPEAPLAGVKISAHRM